MKKLPKWELLPFEFIDLRPALRAYLDWKAMQRTIGPSRPPSQAPKVPHVYPRFVVYVTKADGVSLVRLGYISTHPANADVLRYLNSQGRIRLIPADRIPAT